MNREKAVCLLSGGIDSPVACILASKNFDVIPLHFCLYPNSLKENSMLAIDIIEGLKDKIDFEKIIVFPWTLILKNIKSKIKEAYSCVACRRIMLQTAEILCEKESAKGIITGESLGQKASQTLANINATSRGIEYPILRPLIGLDKKEIIIKAKKLGVWNPQHAGCCPVTPQGPKTNANPREVDNQVKQISPYRLIEKGFKNALETRDLKKDFDEYLCKLADNID